MACESVRRWYGPCVRTGGWRPGVWLEAVRVGVWAGDATLVNVCGTSVEATNRLGDVVLAWDAEQPGGVLRVYRALPVPRRRASPAATPSRPTRLGCASATGRGAYCVPSREHAALKCFLLSPASRISPAVQ